MKRTLAIGLSLALLLFVFYYPWLLGQSTFFFKDSTNFFEPLCSFIGRELAHGHLPLWNPYNYCGMSQVAISSPSLFYPPNWLFAVMPFSVALAWNMIVSQVACGLGGYLLVMAIGWGELPALAAAVMLAFGGYMFSLVSNYTLVSSAAWVPWCLLCVRKIACVEQKTVVWWVLGGALSVFLLVTAGRPEISGPGLLAAALYALLLCGNCAPGAVHARQRLLWAIKGGLLGIFLSMPVILPLLEWVPMSRRAEGLNVSETLALSANWYDLLCLFVAQPLGDLQLRNPQLAALVEPGRLLPYYGSAFVSSVALSLAALGLFKPGRVVYWATIFGLVVSILLALGGNIPGMDWLATHVRALSVLRFPSKFLFFVDLALVLLAARGLKHTLDGRAPLVVPLLFWVGAVIFACVLLFARPIVLPFLPSPAAWQQAAQRAIGGAVIVWGTIAVLVLLLQLQLSGSKRVKAAGSLVVSAIVLSLMASAFLFNHAGGPPDFFQAPQAMAEPSHSPAGGRIAPLYLERLSIPPSYQAPQQPEATVASYQYGRQLLRPFTNIDAAAATPFGFEGSPTGDYAYFFMNAYLRSPSSPVTDTGARTDVPLYRLLQLTGTRIALTQSWRFLDSAGRMRAEIAKLDGALFKLQNDSSELNVRTYELKQTLPTAYLSYNWIGDSRDNVLDRIYHAERSGFDPQLVTLLEESAAPPMQERNSKAQVPFEPADCTRVNSEHTTVSFSANRPALLVLTDQFYPGWVALLDGKEQPILRCNGFVRAVFVPAGRHVVDFKFQPVSFFAGIVVLALAVLWALMLVLQELRANRA